MNFPMEIPAYYFFYWFVNTPGIGSVFIFLVGGGSLLAYALTLRWIIGERYSEDEETFSYPTSAFHDHGPDHH